MHIKYPSGICPTLLLWVVMLFAMTAGAMARPITPMEPGIVLPLLPKAPDGWKTVTSRAYNESIGNPGITTIARRDFTFQPPLPPNAAPGAPLPPLQKVSVTVIDTAFAGEATPLLNEVARPAKPGDPATEKRYVLAEVPVLESAQGNVTTVTAAFERRLIFSLSAENVDTDQLKSWLANANFPALLATVRKAPRVPLASMRKASITFVDELDPKSNRVTEVNFPRHPGDGPDTDKP